MKKLSLVLMLALFSIGSVLAQRTIQGTVTDEDGEALVGATILVQDYGTGTITDIDGKYSLNVPEGATTIEVSYTGFKTSVLELDASNVMDITMEAGVQLKTVTVNALGLTKDRDKTPTASSNVDGGNVVSSGETGVLQGLSGKAAGLSITKNSGDPGSGGFIQIRGQNTITGNTQPLIVLDGMPVYNSNLYTEASTAGVVEQSRLNDINPDDIESVEILKGAAAAALWGTRAANGVIVITTKRGKYNPGGKKFNVNFRSSYSIDQVSLIHPTQTTYGQGSVGNWAANTGFSYGDKIANRTGSGLAATAPGQYFNADGADLYSGYFEDENGTQIFQPIAANTEVYDANGNLIETTGANGGNVAGDFNESNFDQVFQNGWFWDNSISISAGDERSSFFLSMSDLTQQGVIAGNSDYDRTTVRINTDRRFSDWLKASMSSTYSKVFSNRIQTGSNLNGLYLGFLRTSPDFDNSIYRGVYYGADGRPSSSVVFDADGNPLNWSHRGYRRYLGNSAPVYNNPGWTINEQVNTTDVNRFIVSGDLTADVTSWLSLTARAGVDGYSDERITDFPVNSAGNFSNGNFTRTLITERQINSDFFARAGKVFSSDFNIEAIVGLNLNDRRFKRVEGNIQNYILPFYQFSLENAVGASSATEDLESVIRTQAAYASVDVGLFNQLYVNLTGRYEGASTFGSDANRFFFYPSASVGWNFTNLDALAGNDVISFGRVRLAYGNVGVQPSPYLTVTDYIAGGVGEGWGPSLDPGDYGAGTFIQSDVQGNSQLAPEQKTELEAGLDVRFLKDKLGLTFTYYTNTITDAIFAVDVPGSTGFTAKWDNAATIENNGIELELDATVVQKGDFTLNLFGNFTRNRNVVTDLKGVSSVFLNGFTGTSSRAVEGEALGALWGGRWDRNEAGDLILDESGFPTVALEEGVIGDPNPGYRAGFGTIVSWKGLTINALFETAQDQDMWGGTRGVLNFFGRHADDTDVETTVSASEAENIMSYGGFSIADGASIFPNYYVTEANGDITFRGRLEDFGAGDVALDQFWWTDLGGGFGPVAEQFIYDASWTRLRELGVSYRIANQSFQDATKLAYIELGVTGRNLWINTPFVGVDPEMNLTGASNGRGLDYFSNPGTRSYLITVKIGY